MTTIATVPTYVVPGRKFQATVTLVGSGANYVRIWCTAAPPGSALRKKLDGEDTEDKKPRERIELIALDAGKPWNVTPDAFDVGGVYTLKAQEYTLGSSAFGGGYAGDPDGAPSETKVGGETSIALDIGKRIRSTIRAGNDSVDLVLWIWGTTIRETTLATHGEASPALVKATPTARELAAIESSTVRSTLDALIDVAASTAFGTVSTILSNSAGGFVKEWNDHIANSPTVHQNADTDNDLPIGLASAANASNLKDIVNEILRKVRQHYTNDAIDGGTTGGRDSGDYHNVSTKKNDNVNLPVVQGAGTDADAYWAIADIWRSYEAHRISTAVHDAADSTNTLTALPALLAVAREIYTIWASTSPTVPATQSSGVMALVAPGVFEEAPL